MALPHTCKRVGMRWVGENTGCDKSGTAAAHMQRMMIRACLWSVEEWCFLWRRVV